MPLPPADDAQSTADAGCSRGIKYCGPVFDPSGYAEFARGFVKALHRAGVPICLEVVCYERSQPDLGRDQGLLRGLRGRDVRYCAKVVNTTPDTYPNHREPGCVNIGFTMFETTRIPARWVQECNAMDGILVPCSWNREVFEQSGVRVPIRVVPPGMDAPADDELAPRDATAIPARSLRQGSRRPGPSKGWGLWRLSPPSDRQSAWQEADIADYRQRYKFYSIFQWTDRKNPAGLVRAYLAEFRRTDNVCLILKTYRGTFGPKEESLLADEISSIRDSANLADHAPILLISDLLSQDQVRRLHQFGDCFVLPHRAEGVGLPHMAAMAYGKPVIATGFSGNMDFMSSENSILLPYQLRPVTGMRWSPWYEGDMMWAEPDLAALRAAMRRCYANQPHAAELGRKARTHVVAEFSWASCAQRFVAAVAEIVAVARPQTQSHAALAPRGSPRQATSC